MTNLHETDRLVNAGAQKGVILDILKRCGMENAMCLDAASAILRALTAMGGKAEPVAWRYRDAWGRWAYCEAVDNLNGPTVITEKQALCLASPVQARTGGVTEQARTAGMDAAIKTAGKLLAHEHHYSADYLGMAIFQDGLKALEAALSSTDSNKQ